MKFELSKTQEEKFHKWRKKLPKKRIRQMGAGGSYTFHFTPTGIGDIVEVTDSLTDRWLDLTEMENW